MSTPAPIIAAAHTLGTMGTFPIPDTVSTLGALDTITPSLFGGVNLMDDLGEETEVESVVFIGVKRGADVISIPDSVQAVASDNESAVPERVPGPNNCNRCGYYIATGECVRFGRYKNPYCHHCFAARERWLKICSPPASREAARLDAIVWARPRVMSVLEPDIEDPQGDFITRIYKYRNRQKYLNRDPMQYLDEGIWYCMATGNNMYNHRCEICM